MQVSANSGIIQLIDPTTGVAGVTNLTSPLLDTQNKDGALMVVNFGQTVAGAVTSIKAQQGNAADGSDMADIAATVQAIPAGVANSMFFIDIFKPMKRYVRLVVTRGTQNATVSATGLAYGARYQPQGQGTTTGVAVVSP